MTDRDDQIPTVGTYRGVGLHDQQSAERLEVVKRAIDDVFAAAADSSQLLPIAGNPGWPPESRLFAAAMLEALMAIAADERRVRPDIDLEYVRAIVAGLGSQTWRDPEVFASLLDRWSPGLEAPAKREEPLE